MITAALGLDISDFNSKLKQAGSNLSKMGAGGAGFGAALGGAAMGIAAAGMAAVTAAAYGMWEAMSKGGALTDLTAQTGIAIDKLMLLQEGFVQAGMSADDVGSTISKMQKHIANAAQGNAEAQSTFLGLGLSIQDLVSASPDKQLEMIGNAIAGIEDPALKTKAAMDLFGKSGGKLLSLFAGGGLDQIGIQVGNQARIMAENAGVFDKITDALGTASLKIQGFFVGMAGAIAPQLMEAVDAFSAIDLSGIGAQIGEYVAVFLEAFREGTLGEIMLGTLVGVTLKFIEVLVRGLIGAVAAFGTFLREGIVEIVGSLAVLLIAAAAQFAASFLKYIPGMGAAAEAAMKDAGKTREAATKDLAKVTTSAAVAAKDTFKEGYNMFEGSPIADYMGGTGKQIEALMSKAGERAAAVRAENKVSAGTGEGVGAVVSPQVKQNFDFVSSLAKLGGGYGGGGGGDPMLTESRNQTNALQQIIANTRQMIDAFNAKNASNAPLTVLV